MRETIVRAIEWCTSYTPTDLPQTGAELASWSDSVMRLASVPQDDSYRQFIATAVLHLDARKRRMSKQQMVGSLKRSIASQTAYIAIQQLKAKADAANAQVEAGTESQSSNG